MTPEFRHRRRQVWTNRPFQTRVMIALVLLVIVTALAVLAGVYWTLWFTLRTFELQRDPVMVQLFKNVGLFVSLGVLTCAPVVVWGVSRIVLLATHQVAGPLVRILVALQQMRQGDYNVHLRLRRGDLLLQELADQVNQLADALRQRGR